jgi:F0F1-type ATP synthase membrane subunit b/b'
VALIAGGGTQRKIDAAVEEVKTELAKEQKAFKDSVTAEIKKLRGDVGGLRKRVNDLSKSEAKKAGGGGAGAGAGQKKAPPKKK